MAAGSSPATLPPTLSGLTSRQGQFSSDPNAKHNCPEATRPEYSKQVYIFPTEDRGRSETASSACRFVSYPALKVCFSATRCEGPEIELMLAWAALLKVL
ncbi:MAG: hypothetical protein AVDCRST_MAG93-8272 [uncultured Chloroflexia bacterium]|uniref:Uncharacterized protein n=1 Tax=uncultured Chloroflexia bacterium TaxID=1672391 RepID=A0A6J4MXE1_9CHLR|nr:MAG: hypothetical protein AVDCRST_MAG93-8272 [uncultured Chloroflexia bacterium]